MVGEMSPVISAAALALVQADEEDRDNKCMRVFAANPSRERLVDTEMDTCWATPALEVTQQYVTFD